MTSEAASIGVTILGATGSIGINTLDVIARHPQRFRVIALTANRRVDRMVEMCVVHKPQFAVMQQEDAADELRKLLMQRGENGIEVLAGESGLVYVAQLECTEYVMAAIVGAAGLKPTLAAAQSGKRILLANKESLVMSGKLFMDSVKLSGAQLLPIDSEHNAIFQCMPRDFSLGFNEVGVVRILLTASGGPFRDTPLSQLSSVSPEQAVAHPNWNMGKKISVDSATMMNKGLEVIEACWLFNTDPQAIEVVIHPQSVIHSMVEYVDGSVIAQLGNPDMRTPIAHAMAWPSRIESGVDRLNLFSIAQLDFSPPDYQRFPCLKLCQEAMQRGGLAPAVLNAANEIAVDAFLNRRIGFTMIANVIESALSHVAVQGQADNLNAILEIDQTTRAFAREYIKRQA